MTTSLDAAAERLHTIATAAAPAVRARPDLAQVVLRRAHRQRRARRLGKAAAGMGAGLVVLTTVAAANLLGNSDYFTVTQPSYAMESTIHLEDRVVFDKTLSPDRGDVVTVHLVRDGDAYDSMYRVAALAGDTIGCPAGPAGRCEAVVVNGTAMREPYATVTEPFPISTVPEGMVFLLGDNREVARDSRFIGPVRLADVRGVAVRIQDHGGESRAVPGAPAHPGPGNRDNVDPAGPVPPAHATPR
jgi:signal peptidase I